ncbi:MAG: AAA family ATPase, partial [Cyanobacteria bacterium HKST-UBA05]|nr:AAA family ATPase [Cyanobacteria bacterium HKST-UBA05]
MDASALIPPDQSPPPPTGSLSQTQLDSARRLLEQAKYELKQVIVGQDALLDGLLLAVMCKSHVLIEGAPGLAKTLALRSLAAVMRVSFKRIQFTPDLLPSDLIGTRIYNSHDGSFSVEKGPLFGHFILADEINRAPAKV